MNAIPWPTQPVPAAPIVSAEQLATITPPYHLIGPQQVREVIQDWLVRKPKAIVLDTETTGLDAFHDLLVTLQFGDAEEAFILDLRFAGELDSTKRRAYALVAEGLEPLYSGQTVIVGHNLKFDLVYLAQHLGLEITQKMRVYDTMLAEQVLLGGEEDEDTGQRLSANLLHTASRYGYPTEKESRNFFVDMNQRFDWFMPLPTEQLQYIARDCALPALVTKHQATRLREEDLLPVNALEQRVMPALAAMEHHGVYIDVGGWKRYIIEQQATGERLRRDLTTLLSPNPLKPINIRSPKQLLTALNKRSHVSLKSTEEGELKKYKGKDQAIDLLMQYRTVDQVVKMFGESILSKAVGDWIHPEFRQVISTGRSTCAGPNFQQLPAHQEGDDTIRHHVVAPPGCKLLIADFSNIEGRFLAQVSRDANLVRLFASGGDFHTETARMIFGLGPDADPTKSYFAGGVTHRQAAKTINFALMFGMGAQSMAEDLGISVMQARRLMRAYFSTYPTVKAWLERTGQAGVEDGLTRTMSGRIRRYRIPPRPDKHDPQAVASWEAYIAGIRRQACNAPIQGSAADAMKRALVLVFSRLPAEAHMILVVHDELLVQCPETMVPEVKDILEVGMQEAAGKYLTAVANPRPLAKVSDFWEKG